MSQENVAIVRAGIEAFNRRDWDAVLEHAAPDFALDMLRAIGPEQRGFYTVDQLRSFLEDLGGPFESHRLEAEEFIEAGDLVIVPTTAHVRGRDGIEVSARTATVYTIRDGAIVRMCMYQELHEALAAAGVAT
jgi:ketosteroid isomerase-like protein